jgi:osmotically-inducible protein OsmY
MKSDSQLQQDVLAELNWEPCVTASTIGVEVRSGIVTLAGQVGSYSEKWHAERAAQRVSGVGALVVELKVKLAEPDSRTDADVALSVESVLLWSTSIPDDTIKVMVEHGFVTLTGDVGWQYQKVAAADSVRAISGVTGVSNQIAIKPTVSMKAVKGDIEAALRRSASEDAKKITVEVHGADVTLKGEVSSWAERETATTSAWGTPGVRSVRDEMTLQY